MLFVFFFNDTATTEIYTLSLHDALPIWGRRPPVAGRSGLSCSPSKRGAAMAGRPAREAPSRFSVPEGTSTRGSRSEEHTSELQSRQYLVCRLLLEKKKKKKK